MKIVIEEGVGGWSGVVEGALGGKRGCKVLRLTLKAELGGERQYDCGEFAKDKDGEKVDEGSHTAALFVSKRVRSNKK